MPELFRVPPWSDKSTAAVLQPYINLGGVPFIAEEENAYLNSHGFSSVLVKPRPSRDDWPRPKDGEMYLGYAEKTNHAQYGTEAFWGNTSLVESLVAEREKLEELMRRNLIVFHEIALYRSAEIVGLGRGIPQIFVPDPNKITVANFHADAPPEYLEKFRVVGDANRLYKLVDIPFVNSQKAKALYEGVFGQEFKILPNPVDTKRFTPEGEKLEGFGDVNFADGKVNIVYLGRLEPRKGLDTALIVINKLAKNESYAGKFRFIIAGSGPDEEKLRAKVLDMGLSDHVVFMGKVTEVDKPKLYRTSDFCYFPAEYGESFGDVLLEAWASGKATVAGIAFRPDLVTHGVIGYLSKSGRAEEALNLISYLISHKNIRENMGGAARLASLKYDEDKVFGDKMHFIDEAREEKAKQKAKERSVFYYINTTLEVFSGTPSIVRRIMKLKDNILEPMERPEAINQPNLSGNLNIDSRITLP